MKMKSLLLNLVTLILITAVVTSCGKSGKSKGIPNDGQLHGVTPGSKYSLPKPPGMIYIPQGTFHMGPSDEDISYAFTARNKQISINGFWMDATEITNNEYRQFTNWVRDSIAASILNYKKAGGDGQEIIDWTKAKTIKWSDPKITEQLNIRICRCFAVFRRIRVDHQIQRLTSSESGGLQVRRDVFTPEWKSDLPNLPLGA